MTCKHLNKRGNYSIGLSLDMCIVKLEAWLFLDLRVVDMTCSFLYYFLLYAFRFPSKKSVISECTRGTRKCNAWWQHRNQQWTAEKNEKQNKTQPEKD